MPYKRDGTPYWWVSVKTPDGKRVRRSTGTTDRREAEAIESKLKVELFQQKVWGKKQDRSFDEVLAKYLHSRKTYRSFDKIVSAARKLRSFFGEMMMGDIKRLHVLAFIDQQRDEGLIDPSIRRLVAVFCAAINHVNNELEWGLENPAANIKLKRSNARVRWLTHEEARRLVASALMLERNGERLADFITIALHTGCRKNELLKLKWKSVDFGHRLITLQADENKSARLRTVPLNDEAVSALRRRAEFVRRNCPSTEWVMCDEEGNRFIEPKKGFKKALMLAGIEDFRIHDLRHTCASWLVSAGIPLADVKDVLGHSSITMTERYAHLAPQRARAALDSLVSQFGHSDFESRLRATA